MQMCEMLGKKDATYIISVFNVALIHFYSNLRGCLFNMISCCFCRFT